MTYKDKHGKEIKAGMEIRHVKGQIEKVFACGEDEDDLGVNASNESFTGFQEINREFYPLHQFDLADWEIVK